MLVLTRKPGEQIVIADNIRITVVAIGHGRVKIGIDAPSHVHIDRQEVHDRKQAEDLQAHAAPVVIEQKTPANLHNRIAGKLPEVPPSSNNVHYRKKSR